MRRLSRNESVARSSQINGPPNSQLELNYERTSFR